MGRTLTLPRMTSRTRTPLPWLILCIAIGAGGAQAQSSQSLLDRQSRLNVTDVALEVALRTLHRSSGVAIAFSPDRIPRQRLVTCRCEGLTVGQALDRILEGTGLEYLETRRQILVGETFASPSRPQRDERDSVSSGTLEGQVLLFPTGQPLAQTLVTVARLGDVPTDSALPLPAFRETHTDAGGRFTFALPPGRYVVGAEALGAQGSGRVEVSVRVGQTTRITVRLEAEPFRLEEIVVTPSSFGILTTNGASVQLLTREEVESQPHPGNDIVRAIERLPGISTTDYTAKPFVRGARAEEVITILDGLELHEPYHLKNWDGSLSIVDVETVGEVSLATGGFTAEYGRRSAGVLEMRTADPPLDRPTRTTVGLDFMSSIVKSEGTFHEGKGTWLASARRGFLGFVFDLMNRYTDETLKPSYYDLFSRVAYQVRPGHRVSAHVLHAADKNHGVEMDSTIFRVRYGSSYGWVNWEADFTRSLAMTAVASFGVISRDREGTDYWEPGGPPVLRVGEENTTDVFGLRQDWRFRFSPRTMLKWGLDLRRVKADHEYSRYRFSYLPNMTDPSGPDFWPQHDTVTVEASRTGSDVGAYLAGRVRPIDALTVEAGLRYDRQTHTGGWQVSPRLHAAWQITPGTALRASWGHYHQAHGLDELWVADADTTLYPTQLAEHRILGMEHRFQSGYSLRLEAYQRLLSDALPEYRRVARNLGALWEESLHSRIFVHPEEGRAAGVELFLKSPPGGRFDWSGSYALSRTEERVGGKWVPRPYDQRHALNLQLAYRPTPDWSIAAGWVYHSPWPFTEIHFGFGETIHGHPLTIADVGVLNQGRLPPYTRLDFRASRRFRLSRGDLLLYVDVFNVLNRENALDYEQEIRWTGARWKIEQSIYPQLMIMPSLGLKWTF